MSTVPPVAKLQRLDPRTIIGVTAGDLLQTLTESDPVAHLTAEQRADIAATLLIEVAQ